MIEQEKFEYTKEVIRAVIRRRTDNSMAKKKEDKKKNNDLQNTTQKPKDRATRTIKPGVNCDNKVIMQSSYFCS